MQIDQRVLPLPRGSATRLRLEPGTRLRLLEGALVVEHPPAWLDGLAVRETRPLRRGESAVVERAAWVALHATGVRGARLLVTPPAPAPRAATAMPARAMAAARRAWGAAQRLSGALHAHRAPRPR